MSWPAAQSDFEFFINEDPCTCVYYKKGASTAVAATFDGRLVPYVITGEERQALSRIGPMTTVQRGWVLMVLPQDDLDVEKEDEIQITWGGRTQNWRVGDCAYFPEHWEINIRKFT